MTCYGKTLISKSRTAKYKRRIYLILSDSDTVLAIKVVTMGKARTNRKPLLNKWPNSLWKATNTIKEKFRLLKFFRISCFPYLWQRAKSV